MKVKCVIGNHNCFTDCPNGQIISGHKTKVGSISCQGCRYRIDPNSTSLMEVDCNYPDPVSPKYKKEFEEYFTKVRGSIENLHDWARGIWEECEKVCLKK